MNYACDESCVHECMHAACYECMLSILTHTHIHNNRHHEYERPKGTRALSERDAYLLRAIMVIGGVSDTKLNIVLALCFLYLTGCIIPLALLWTKGTVSAVINRVQWYEKKKQSDKLREMMQRYPRASIFLSSDDSDGRHAICTAFPYIDGNGNRHVERELLSVSHYVKKRNKHHAATDKEALQCHGYPLENIDGGNTDHPAESEIRELITLCHQHDPGFYARWLGCGNHKTALVCKYISGVMCEDKAMHIFSHKQFGYVYRYVFHDGKKNNIRVVREFATQFMGGEGFWCYIPKMMQDQRYVLIKHAYDI